MADPQFPIDLVSPGGVVVAAEDLQAFVDLVYGRGYRLRRAVPGVAVAVAEPARASEPREVTSWRGQEPSAEPAVEPEPEAPTEAAGVPAEPPSEPEARGAAARLRKSSRKA